MRFFIYGILGFLLLALFANSAFAATTKPWSVRTQNRIDFLDSVGPSSGSVPVVFETIALTPQNQQVTRYTTRPVALTSARLGSLARSATGGPAILAATAAFLAYDYFYNETEDKWEVLPSYPDGYSDVYPQVSSCRRSSGAAVINEISLESCRAEIIAFNNLTGFTPSSLRRTTNTSLQTVYCLDAVQNSTGNTFSCFNGNSWTLQNPPSSVMSWPPTISIIPNSATDSQLGDAIKSAPPQAVSDILNDPISTGTWRDRWPEIEPVAQDIEDQLGHDIEGAPAPVTPDQTITDASTSAPPEIDSGSMSAEWPAFCSWAGVVCTFMDWVQEPFEEPAPVEVPYVEVDFEEDYDSGIAIASCPAPIAIVTQFGTVEFDWSNTCSLAEMIRPLVIAFSYLIGIYILLRVK